MKTFRQSIVSMAIDVVGPRAFNNFHSVWNLRTIPRIRKPANRRPMTSSSRWSTADALTFAMSQGEEEATRRLPCYTVDWRSLPDSFLAYHEHRGKPIPAPPLLPEMLRVAETLSRDFVI